MNLLARHPVTYRATRLPLIGVVAAAAVSLVYPIVWGPFALALTLFMAPVLATVGVAGGAVSWLIVRPRVIRASAVKKARWYAGGLLALTGAVVSAGWLLFVALGAREADGSPHWALLPPIGLALGLALAAYILVIAIATPWSVSAAKP